MYWSAPPHSGVCPIAAADSGRWARGARMAAAEKSCISDAVVHGASRPPPRPCCLSFLSLWCLAPKRVPVEALVEKRNSTLLPRWRRHSWAASPGDLLRLVPGCLLWCRDPDRFLPPSLSPCLPFSLPLLCTYQGLVCQGLPWTD